MGRSVIPRERAVTLKTNKKAARKAPGNRMARLSEVQIPREEGDTCLRKRARASPSATSHAWLVSFFLSSTNTARTGWLARLTTKSTKALPRRALLQFHADGEDIVLPHVGRRRSLSTTKEANQAATCLRRSHLGLTKANVLPTSSVVGHRCP